MALRDIDFSVKPGETIGILGATGSGKTSLVNLINRMYDVTSGTLEVGGQDVRNYDLEAFRDAVSVVLQKNELFSGTVEENLRWGKSDASLEDCDVPAGWPAPMNLLKSSRTGIRRKWNAAEPISPAVRSRGSALREP